MKTSRFFARSAAGLTLALALIAALAMAAQTGADEVLAKKYANILGRYDLDLGGELHPIEVLVKDGKLWIDDGDGYPAEIKPVGDSGLEFEGRDQNGSALTVTFIKDDAGAVAKMRLLIPDAGADVYGNKIK